MIYQRPQVYSLAQVCKGAAIVPDTPLSKQRLAHLLSTSRPTVKRLEQVAYDQLTEFREDYPEFPKELWLVKKSKYNREAKLTPFQCWIISLLKKAMSDLNRKQAVESFIELNSYLFTKKSFRQELERLVEISA